MLQLLSGAFCLDLSEQTINSAVLIQMARLFQKKSSSRLPAEKGKAIVLSLDQGYRGLDLLIDLIRKIRPDHYRNIEQAETRMK
ncbi:MAG: hypothetical protein EOO04_25985, partial [Chitinophagaceae bacterium]